MSSFARSGVDNADRTPPTTTTLPHSSNSTPPLPRSDDRNNDNHSDNDIEGRDGESDHSNEGVREKLKKTTIAPAPADVSAPAVAASQEDEVMAGSESPREEAPRRTRKRSHDESEEDNPQNPNDGGDKRRIKAHERKRSREVSDAERLRMGRALERVKTPPTHQEEEVGGIAERVSSPRGDRKRGLGQEETAVTNREQKTPRTEDDVGTKEKVVENKDTNTASAAKEGSPTEEKTAQKIPASSGFANTSTASPFATTGATNVFGSSSGAPNLFASSKFGAMSNSTASPFGTLSSAAPKSRFGNTSSTSPFGGLGSTNVFGGSKPAFGASTTPSTGGAFGSAFGGSGASFASLTKSSGSAKPFGTPVSDNEKSDDEDSAGSDDEKDTPGSAAEDSAKAPEGLKERKEVITGEENEITLFKSMGKVFIFDSAVKRWKDRGRGQIKLNRTPPAADDYHNLLPATTAPQKQSARFIMRTEGTYTLVLNSPVYQGMKIGELDGSPPTGQNLQLMAMEGGVPTTTTLKFKSNTVARELYDLVKELQEEFYGSDEKAEEEPTDTTDKENQ